MNDPQPAQSPQDAAVSNEGQTAAQMAAHTSAARRQSVRIDVHQQQRAAALRAQQEQQQREQELIAAQNLVLATPRQYGVQAATRPVSGRAPPSMAPQIPLVQFPTQKVDYSAFKDLSALPQNPPLLVKPVMADGQVFHGIAFGNLNANLLQHYAQGVLPEADRDPTFPHLPAGQSVVGSGRGDMLTQILLGRAGLVALASAVRREPAVVRDHLIRKLREVGASNGIGVADQVPAILSEAVIEHVTNTIHKVVRKAKRRQNPVAYEIPPKLLAATTRPSLAFAAVNKQARYIEASRSGGDVSRIVGDDTVSYLPAPDTTGAKNVAQSEQSEKAVAPSLPNLEPPRVALADLIAVKRRDKRARYSKTLSRAVLLQDEAQMQSDSIFNI